MKNLVIFFKGFYLEKHKNDAFFGIADRNKRGFLDFFYKFKNDNINIFICRGEESYLGNNTFSNGFFFDKENKEFIYLKEKISADFIFNRSSFYFENGFNNNFLINFCKNKLNIISLFPNLSAKTYFILDKNDLEKKLELFDKSDKKVLKPIDGSFGENIVISNDKNKLLDYIEYPCLLQEFLDTSIGIPKIHKGIHDLRIVVINGKIVYGMYRTPGEGTYISNISLGGTLNKINQKKLGKDITSIVKKIDDSISFVGDRFYSIDLGYTDKGLRIFELNSSPAIRDLSLGTTKLHEELYKIIYDKLKTSN